MQRVLHHVRDADVSGNTFDVPLNKLERIDCILVGLRHFVNIAIMIVTYELPRYSVLRTGIFACTYKYDSVTDNFKVDIG